jgi:hypothetical protein
MGDTLYERQNGKRQGTDLKYDKQFPQGYGRQSLLQEKLEQQAPFYLSRHQTTINRKTNENNYASAMDAARARFEDKLTAEKSKNKQSM